MATIPRNRILILSVSALLALILLVFYLGPRSSSRVLPPAATPTPSPLPTAFVPPAGWKTSSDPQTGLSFRYPQDLGTSYISLFDWPPKLSLQNEAFTCTSAGSETAPAGKTILKTINSRQYCLTIETGAAAGSVYEQYAYASAFEGRTAILTFTIRSPQCGNYPEPRMSACQAEESAFDINPTVDQIFQTIHPSRP